jgi:hypothetical protein
MFDQLLTKAPDGGGIRHITTQFKVAKLAEKQIAKQGLGKFNIREPKPDTRYRAMTREKALAMDSSVDPFCWRKYRP